MLYKFSIIIVVAVVVAVVVVVALAVADGLFGLNGPECLDEPFVSTRSSLSLSPSLISLAVSVDVQHNERRWLHCDTDRCLPACSCQGPGRIAPKPD